MIGAVSGQTLGTYFERCIFRPLGMAFSQFGRPDSPRVATVHNRQPDGRLRPGGTGRPLQPELESGGGLFADPVVLRLLDGFKAALYASEAS